jgi:uncharacterized sulfatase
MVWPAKDSCGSRSSPSDDNENGVPRLLAWVWWLLALPPAAAGPPHIVVFPVDDMSVGDRSTHHPASGIPTPDMQRLAAAGMTFRRAFVSSPSCAPRRASLLTRLSPVRHGAMCNHSMPDATVKSWPAYFREAGYETAAIGKTAHYHAGKRYGFAFLSHGGSSEYECIRFAAGWPAKRGGGAYSLIGGWLRGLSIGGSPGTGSDGKHPEREGRMSA